MRRLATWILAALIMPAMAVAADSTIQVDVCTPTAIPTLDSPAQGAETEQSSIMVSGTAANGDTVTILRGGSEVGSQVVGGSGTYGVSTPLTLGANQLQARSVSACGAVAFSGTVTVTRTTPSAGAQSSSQDTSSQATGAQSSEVPTSQAPRVATGEAPVIFSPISGAILDRADVLIKGSAAPGAKVVLILNSNQAAILFADDEGVFQVRLDLSEGRNSLYAQSEDGLLRSGEHVLYYQPATSFIMRVLGVFWPLIGFGLIAVVGLYLFSTALRRRHEPIVRL